MCHKSKVNRRIEVNHRLNELKAEARSLLCSEEGLRHRSKRPIEVEAVFGQMKSNNKFSRFTLRSLQKVNIEFGLMAIGHNLRKLTVKQRLEEKNQQIPASENQNRLNVVFFEDYQSKYRYAA